MDKKMKRMLGVSMTLAMCANVVQVATAPATVFAEKDANVVYSQDFEDPNLEIGNLPSEISIASKSSDSTVGVYCDDGNKVLKIGHQSGDTKVIFSLPQKLSNGVYDIEYMFKSDLHGAYVSDMMSIINGEGGLLTNPGIWYTIYINHSAPIIPANLFSYGWFPMKTRINVDNGNINWYLDGNYATTTQAYSTDSSVTGFQFAASSTGRNGDPGYLGSGAMEGYGTGKGNYYIDDLKITKVEDLSVISLTVENGAKVRADVGAITAGFNYIINPATVSNETVQLFKGEDRITEGYSVYSSGSALVVTFDGELDKNADYTIKLDGVKPSDAQYSASPSELVSFTTLGYTFLSDFPLKDGATFVEKDKLPQFTAPDGVVYDSITVSKGDTLTSIKPGDVLTDIGNYTLTVVATKNEKQEERTIEFSVVKYDGTVFVEDFEDYNAGEHTDIQVGTDVWGQNVVVNDGNSKALMIDFDIDQPYDCIEKLDLGGTYDSGVYEFSAKVRFIRHGLAGSDFASLYNSQSGMRIVQPYAWSDFIFHEKSMSQWGGPYIPDLYGSMDDSSNYVTITHKVDFDNGVRDLYYDNAMWLMSQNVQNNLPVDSMLFGFYIQPDPAANGSQNKDTRETIYIDEIRVKKVGLTVIKKELFNENSERIENLSEMAGKNATAKILLRESDTKTAVGDYMAVFALYDGNKLIDVKTVGTQEIKAADGYASAVFGIPDTSSGCKISCMIIDSLGTIKPMMEKQDF